MIKYFFTFLLWVLFIIFIGFTFILEIKSEYLSMSPFKVFQLSRTYKTSLENLEYNKKKFMEIIEYINSEWIDNMYLEDDGKVYYSKDSVTILMAPESIKWLMVDWWINRVSRQWKKFSSFTNGVFFINNSIWIERWMIRGYLYSSGTIQPTFITPQEFWEKSIHKYNDWFVVELKLRNLE